MITFGRHDDVAAIKLQLQPTFTTFKDVFGGWPYCCRFHFNGEPILAVGTLRGSSASGTVLRAVTINEMPPADASDASFHRNRAGLERHIYIMTWRSGIRLRFTTAIGGQHARVYDRFVLTRVIGFDAFEDQASLDLAAEADEMLDYSIGSAR